MSNVSIVIISKDQADELPKMVSALREQLPDIERCFVLDRCIDNSKQVMIDLNENFIENTEGVGFCAATARNVGLRNVNPYNDVLFLDGDRYPTNISIELIEQALERFDITLIKAHHNPHRPWFTNNFTENPKYNNYYNDVWSCGFVIRRSAIEKIKLINNGRLFNEIFNGNYGEEDANLGDMALCLGLTCGGFPDFVYLNGEVGEKIDSPMTVNDKKQHNIRKLIRMALFIKFNKSINNETEINDRPYAIKTNIRNASNQTIYVG